MNNRIFSLIFWCILFTLPRLSAQEQVLWQDSTLVFDFGDIDYGKEYKHAFVFKNNTTDTLNIETIRADCGCTVPDWEDTFTLPGSNGVIQVTYTPKKHGYFSEKIRVFFYEQKKSITLSVEGYVFED